MNLLRLFEFYLMAMFVVGTVRRFGLYQSVARAAFSLARRYKKLFGVVVEKSGVLITWTTVLPAALTLVLWALQAMLTRIVFPHAELLTRELLSRVWFLPFALIPCAAMLAVDVFFLVRVGAVDAADAERYFSQAESWLGTWKSSAVRVATLGYVNPHTMVHDEVRKALDTGKALLHSTLWWTVVQTSIRVILGLALWTIWAVGPPT